MQRLERCAARIVASCLVGCSKTKTHFEAVHCQRLGGQIGNIDTVAISSRMPSSGPPWQSTSSRYLSRERPDTTFVDSFEHSAAGLPAVEPASLCRDCFASCLRHQVAQRSHLLVHTNISMPCWTREWLRVILLRSMEQMSRSPAKKDTERGCIQNVFGLQWLADLP